MKTIKTNNAQLNAIVDDSDFWRLSKFKWFYTCGAVRRKLWVDGKTINIPMANEVMQVFGIKFDHADRDPLNNTKSNLRQVTTSQNGANVAKRKGTSSLYKGVHWFKRGKKWTAHIGFNGKKIHLGTFTIETDAATAYDKAAIEKFGEFANINFK